MICLGLNISCYLALNILIFKKFQTMEKYQMIADIGGTSSRWIWFNANSDFEYRTAGFNPLLNSWDHLEKIIAELSQNINVDLESIDIYAAGFINADQKDHAIRILQKYFSFKSITIQSDIMLVVNASPKSDKKVVLILGTGCNSIYCTPESKINIAPPLGFALGDDGSGAYFGRALLRAYYYGHLEESLSKALEKFQDMDRNNLLQKVYKGEAPSAFLASFFPFIIQNRQHEQIESLIESGLKDHFVNIVRSYPGDANYHYSGSVAWQLRDYLRSLFAENGLYLGEIIEEPLQEILKQRRKND